MNSRDNFFELGKVIRAKGLKGEIELFIDADNPGHYRNMESVLLEINHELVPFFIEQIKIHDRFATIKFDGTSSFDSACALVDSLVFLPIEKLPVLQGKRFYFHEVTGCKVMDKTLGFIGEIRQVLDLPKQPLAELIFNEKELLFPLLEIFIEKLDRENKTLYVDLPEGLVDIYLA